MRQPLLLSVAFAALTAQPAFANTIADDEMFDDIVVTGTRDASRTQFDTMALVDVVAGDSIQNSGSDDLSDTLLQLAPSFNVQRLPANDGLLSVRPLRLADRS